MKNSMTRQEKLYKAMSAAMWRGGAMFEGKRISCQSVGMEVGKGRWTLDGKRISRANLLKITEEDNRKLERQGQRMEIKSKQEYDAAIAELEKISEGYEADCAMSGGEFIPPTVLTRNEARSQELEDAIQKYDCGILLEKLFKCVYSEKVEGMEIRAKSTEYFICIDIKPKGFWNAAHIQITKGESLSDSSWDPCQISCGSGGEDGSLSSIESAEFKALALLKAVEIAKRLEKVFSA